MRARRKCMISPMFVTHLLPYYFIALFYCVVPLGALASCAAPGSLKVIELPELPVATPLSVDRSIDQKSRI